MRHLLHEQIHPGTAAFLGLAQPAPLSPEAQAVRARVEDTVQARRLMRRDPFLSVMARAGRVRLPAPYQPEHAAD
jgi:hypothetical protein